jgi:hypothetical protein
MAQLYCGSCWNGSRQPTPATWDIEGDLFCDAHKQSQGYDASEGKRLGRADAIASATPAPPKSWDEFKERKRAKSELAAAASSDPEASPGSFGLAIKKAFLPKPAASHNGTAIVPRRTIALPETKGNSMEKRTCSVSGCAKRLNSTNRSGRCSEHYYVPKTPRFTGVNYVCTVDGCKKKLRSDNRSGICKQHQARTGKPNGRPLTKPNAPQQS